MKEAEEMKTELLKGTRRRRRTEATDEERNCDTRIRVAIGAMPYGGGVASTVDGRDLYTLDDVASYLECLRMRLSGVSEQAKLNEAELSERRQDEAALGRILSRVLARGAR